MHIPASLQPAGFKPRSGGSPLPFLRWDASKAAAYGQNFRFLGPQLHHCRQLVREGSLQQAFDAPGDTLVAAARQSGCRMSVLCDPSRSASRRPPDMPYFDDECREMRAEFRRVMKMDPETGRLLARRYTTKLRRKSREYRQRQTPAILKQLRSNDKGFWRRFNAHDASLPAPRPPCTVAELHAKLCAPPFHPSRHLRSLPQPLRPPSTVPSLRQRSCRP